MGGPQRDDGAQGLSTLAQRLPAVLAQACARFDDDVTRLAAGPLTPETFAVGIREATGRLRAPLEDAAQQAARSGEDELPSAVRRGRAQVDAALREVLGSALLLAQLGESERGPVLAARRAFEDAGARLDAPRRRKLAAIDEALAERTDAFADHLAAGPTPSRVRARLAQEAHASTREDLWSALHHHAADAAPLCLDILRLRRARARAIGFASFAAWVDRDAAFAGHRDAWLTAMARAARSRADAAQRPAPWNRHRPTDPAPSEPLLAPRDAVASALLRALEALAPGARVVLDLEPRPTKRAGAWTYRGRGGPPSVTICASLPPVLRVAELRSLLHEAGHAAEALMTPGDTAHPADAIELASTGLEPFAWSEAALRELGIVEVDSAALAKDRLRRLGAPALHQIALARADQALHADFDPDRDGSPVPWARRVLESVEGAQRDPRDAAIGLHLHLFGRPRGYAGRYAAYPLGDALALHLAAGHGDQSIQDALRQRAHHLWTAAGLRDPLRAIERLSGRVPGPGAFVRIARR